MSDSRPEGLGPQVWRVGSASGTAVAGPTLNRQTRACLLPHVSPELVAATGQGR